ncbi:MAG: fumarylacetoacetate hydrolase family protein [Candidatus Omnitrophica bacterium]|nr:fumarylacetoacetate hydrolase family protein [Candidatus Omnitrophota bacterium]
MRLCRFQTERNEAHPGLVIDENTVLDLAAANIDRLETLLENDNLDQQLVEFSKSNLPRLPLEEMRLLTPVERQEVWAAGVTYLRSKKARKAESDFAAIAYENVYHALRPELFFKSLPEKVSGPLEPVGIRKDTHWSVPEAELALVINSRRRIVGYTLGNDMSARRLEGENLLYLPQAKIYDHSCAVGPCITVGPDEAEVRTWKIHLDIKRKDEWLFKGATALDRLKRPFNVLVDYLTRSQTFPHGVILLTGTGIVLPDNSALQEGDIIKICLDEIGTLENPVAAV